MYGGVRWREARHKCAFAGLVHIRRKVSWCSAGAKRLFVGHSVVVVWRLAEGSQKGKSCIACKVASLAGRKWTRQGQGDALVIVTGHDMYAPTR